MGLGISKIRFFLSISTGHISAKFEDADACQGLFEAEFRLESKEKGKNVTESSVLEIFANRRGPLIRRNTRTPGEPKS